MHTEKRRKSSKKNEGIKGRGKTSVDRWVEGWKVVRPRNDYYVSFLDGPGTVIYCHETPTTPNLGDGPLCVFNSDVAAFEFCKEYIHMKSLVVPCKYRPSKHRKVWNFSGEKKHLKDLPAGTVLADEVLLIKYTSLPRWKGYKYDPITGEPR